ncbi:MAG: M2 family metallopeptidase [Pseudoxanthomonas sp.]
MKPRHLHAVLAACLAAGLLSACGGGKDAGDGKAPPRGEDADAFVKRVNDEYRAQYPENSAAQWLSSTYIGEDSQRLAAAANQRSLAQLDTWIAQAARFEGQPLAPASDRAIHLLKLMSPLPAPRDPQQLAELTRIAVRMQGAYGAARYCSGEGQDRQCRSLGELEQVLRSNRDYDAQLEAWQGWHAAAAGLRRDYARFVELADQGARDLGYADAGELWRSGYDMPATELGPQTDRLWEQVKPLYTQLHCYARARLEKQYGARGQAAGGMLPAHLLGNMWQQDWSNLWDLLQPYPDAGGVDVTDALRGQDEARYAKLLEQAGLDQDDPFESAREKRYSQLVGELSHAPSPEERQRLNRQAYDQAVARTAALRRQAALDTAKAMAAGAQSFYTSLGMPALPESFWRKSQFVKPLERDVVCHASAWDMDMAGDVRIKMCVTPGQEDYATLYHELGHLYYDLAYHQQPPLFQNGANDGFHEAIGDTIVLAMTPEYLQSVGLLPKQAVSAQTRLNAQMHMALSKIAFLPFGLMIDRWRWGVFDGSIKPDRYNQAWWQLKARYQGVAPATPRGEEFFDPGAKYHVPANTPYTRYFIAHILQFQFYKALCQAAGWQGPLSQCSFAGSKAAGQKFWSMMEKGSSQPWQATLKQMTGSDHLDAGPLLEYFQPLQAWLAEQNEGQQCGWQAEPGAGR